MPGKTVNPHTVYQQLGVDVEPPLLAAGQKLQIAQNSVPFSIIKAQSGLMGENGEFWMFTAQYGQYKFRFNMSDPVAGNKPEDVAERITAEYNAIKSITEAGDAVGPYLLKYVEWRGGNPFYKLEPASLPDDALSSNQESLPF